MQMEKREEDRSFVRGKKEENWLPICQRPSKKRKLFFSPLLMGAKKERTKSEQRKVNC